MKYIEVEYNREPKPIEDERSAVEVAQAAGHRLAVDRSDAIFE